MLRIRDVYLGSRQQNGNKKEGWKTICCHHTFLCSHKFHTKLKIILFLKCRRKNLGQFQRIINFLSKKITLSSQKYGLGIGDLRSGIRTKTYSGSRIQRSKRPRIRIRNTVKSKISWQSCRIASPPRTLTACSGWTALCRPPPTCCGCSSSGSPLPPQERRAVRRRRCPVGGGCTRRRGTDERTVAAPHQEWDRRIFFVHLKTHRGSISGFFYIVICMDDGRSFGSELLSKKLQHWLLLVL